MQLDFVCNRTQLTLLGGAELQDHNTMNGFGL